VIHMSFNDEINKMKDEIEKTVKAIPSHIDAYSAKLSEIENRLEAEVDRSKLWGELSELRDLRHQAKGEENRTKHDLRHGFHEIKDKIRSSEHEIPSGDPFREEMEGKLEELNDYLDDKLDEVGDSLDSFFERVDEVEERLREKMRDWRRGTKDARRAYISGVRGPDFSVPEIHVPEIKIPDFGKIIDESLSKAWTGVSSAIVSSVRLPQTDLNLIDTLANSGIFKSRNEGIAFFAHRGIEASEEWLTKVREKLDEIRKLQDETKKEIDKVIGESAKSEEKTEEKEGEKESEKENKKYIE
jgi:Arc/MetJ-type ribon-helix-helix transcriptional regulator